MLYIDEAAVPRAFAVNLLGAILGGCLEYLSLLTGYQNLLILVAVLYGLAFLLRPRLGPLQAVLGGAGP